MPFKVCWEKVKQYKKLVLLAGGLLVLGSLLRATGGGTPVGESFSFWFGSVSCVVGLLLRRTRPMDAAAVPQSGVIARPMTASGVNPNVLVESLEPLRKKISAQTAYLGVVVGSLVFAFALFLPWASIPAGLQASDGGSASGWAEFGWVAFLPLLMPILSVLMNRRPVSVERILLCALAAVLFLAFDNILGRSQWHRPMQMVGRSFDSGANYGSSLDVGFWLALIGLVAVSLSLVTWTLHRSAEVQVSPITV